MEVTLQQIAEKINLAKTISIYGHQKTDCDCVASMLAFALMCEALGKKTLLFLDSQLNESIKHLPGLEKLNKEETGKKADLLVCLDVATAERLGKFRTEFLLHNNTIKIDHHQDSEPFGRLEYTNKNLPANCLILKQLQKLLKVKDSSELNYLLLSGTMADTGCFRFNTTNASTLKIAAEMVDNLNTDYTNVVYPLFNNISKNALMIEAYAISNAKFYNDDKIAVSYFSFQTLNKLNTTMTESSRRIVRLLDIDTVKITIAITEEEKGKFFVSYRSKGNIDVSVCARAFGGGGHTGASGCKLYGNEKTVLQKVLKEAQKALEKYEDAK